MIRKEPRIKTYQTKVENTVAKTETIREKMKRKLTTLFLKKSTKTIEQE